MRRITHLFFVLIVLSLSPLAISAQEASPDASPVAADCVAPALPPGTPTPMEALMNLQPLEDRIVVQANETRGARFTTSSIEGWNSWRRPTPAVSVDVIALTLMPQPDGIENRSRLARADHSLPLVGDVVNQSVVISVVALAIVNVAITQAYVMLVPQRIA